jgi:hypothetical protein
MAVKGANSPFNICYVSVASSVISNTGVVTPGPNVNYYFQSSRIYENTTVANRTGITYVDADKWEGEEPLVKIEQLILSKKLIRLIGEVDLGAKGIKPMSILCARQKAGDLLSDDKAKNLDGADALNNKGNSIGKFFSVRTGTRNRFS